MKYINKTQAVLLLKDGTIFYGKSIGISGTTFGEIAFNTGTTGYQEIFTDPSYFGQIMVTTNAHIGNYGVNSNEVESDGVKIAGLVCKNFSFNYSRPDATESLYDYFSKHGLVVISDVDRAEIHGFIPVGTVGLSDHLVLFVVHDEVPIALSREIELQVFSDVFHVDSQGSCPVAIDLDG